MESLLEYGNRLLRQTIRRGNPSLATELDNLWFVAQTKIHEFQEGKTAQGTLHCLRVESNLGLLLQNKLDKFKEIDLFVLSAAAALHDIGKIKRQTTSKKEDHGLEGRSLLLDEKVWSEFFQNRRKAEAIAHIIGTHDNGQIDSLPEEPFVIGSPPGLLLRSLAAIFRLADMLDTDYRRCPYILQKIRATKSVRAPETWLPRGAIGGWDFYYDGKSIVLQESSKTDREHKALLEYVNILNKAITPSQRRHLENCLVLFWDQGIRSDTLHLPFGFRLSETRMTPPVSSETSRVYENIAKEYLRHLVWDSSEVDLDGLGTFQDKRPTQLSRIFIDVETELSERWRPQPPRIDEPEPDRRKESEHRRWQKKKKQIYVRWLESLPSTVRDLETGGSLPITKALTGEDLRRAVVLGHPGSGKSTIMQFLCLTLAEKSLSGASSKPIIPFQVIVRHFLSEKSKRARKYSIMEYLADEVSSHLQRMSPEGFVKHCLTERESLVIFDGLDEVVRHEDRERIRKEILSFAGRFHRARCIVTSRIVGYKQAPFDPNRFFHFELQDLKYPHIVKFIERWYSERESDPLRRRTRTDSLIKALDNPNIAKLARNPLLLTIMALIHRAEAALPEQRVHLYEKCVEVFLLNRELSKDLFSYNSAEIRACHEYLGYWMQARSEKDEEKQTEVDTRELKESLAQFLDNVGPLPLGIKNRRVQEFIDVAQRRVGLIVERGLGIFAFGHRCFQEYFAACYLISHHYGIEELWKTIENKIFSAHWHEVIRLLAGRLGIYSVRGLDELMEKIWKADGKKRGIILAEKIAVDRVQMSRSALFRVCDKIIGDLYETSDEARVRSHVKHLASLLETDAADHILSRIHDLGQKRRGKMLNIYLVAKRMMAYPEESSLKISTLIDAFGSHRGQKTSE